MRITTSAVEQTDASSMRALLPRTAFHRSFTNAAHARVIPARPSLTFTQIAQPNTLESGEVRWLCAALAQPRANGPSEWAVLAARRIELAQWSGGRLSDLRDDEMTTIVSVLSEITELGGPESARLRQIKRNMMRTLRDRARQHIVDATTSLGRAAPSELQADQQLHVLTSADQLTVGLSSTRRVGTDRFSEKIGE